jgi:hypothetical protein
MTNNLINPPFIERNYHLSEAADIIGCDYRELGPYCIIDNDIRTDWILADDVRDLLNAKRRTVAQQTAQQPNEKVAI